MDESHYQALGVAVKVIRSLRPEWRVGFIRATPEDRDVAPAFLGRMRVMSGILWVDAPVGEFDLAWLVDPQQSLGIFEGHLLGQWDRLPNREAAVLHRLLTGQEVEGLLVRIVPDGTPVVTDASGAVNQINEYVSTSGPVHVAMNVVQNVFYIWSSDYVKIKGVTE